MTTAPMIDESAEQQLDATASDATDAATPIDLVDAIESVISSLDHKSSAMVKRDDHGYLWKFQYGSVEVFVQITGMQPEDTFTAWAGVLSLPATNEAKLMRQVLEMNWTVTLDAKFAIMGNRIVIAVSRPVADLAASEVSRSITLVATIADDYDDVFKAEYH
jgi:Putative bacterial sensory transduction regulator